MSLEKAGEAFFLYLVEKAFGGNVAIAGQSPLGKGDFTEVVRLRLTRPPWDVAVKFFREDWQLDRYALDLEVQTLRYLKDHGNIPVPEVYFYHLGNEAWPREAFVMEFVDGDAMHKAYRDLPADGQNRLAENVAEALLALHSVRNDKGYGPLGGPWKQRWLDTYLPKIQRAYEHMDRSRELPEIVHVAETSYYCVEDILRSRTGDARLVHGDLFWPNIRIDPETLQVTGFIDPVYDPIWPAPQWGDVEGDLSVLMFGNCRWGTDIVQCYARHSPLDEGFRLRRRFYDLWLMLDIYRTVGFQNQEWDQRIAADLNKELQQNGLC